MNFCTRCGAARHGTEPSCLSCGHPFPSTEVPAWTDPTDLVETTPRPTGRWSTPFVAAVVLVVLIMAGATVGVLVARADHDPPTRSASGPGTVAPPSVPSPPSDLPNAPTGGSGDEPTFEATEEPTTDEPTTATTIPADPNGVVTLSDTAALDPAAPAVLSLVSRYFQAINTRDYQSYRDIHTAESQAALDPDTFRLGFESTEDSDAVVTTIGVQPDGQPTAEVTFTSHQNSVDGPNGDTCDRWSIILFLEPGGDGYLIGSAPSTYHASHQAC